jgi:hypothetical protein
VRREIATMVLITAAALAACGGRGPVPSIHEGLHTASAEITVAESVAKRGGYESGAVEVLVSRAQLRILISDSRLAEAEPAVQAAAAARAATTAEQALATDPEFPSIQSISVAIVHPAQLRAGALTSHTEEVFEFNRGADGGFGLARH